MKKITNFVGESIPVLSSNSDVLLAVVTEGNIFQAVLDVQDNVKKIERN
jgi:CIC family chloride channel protein